MQVLVCGGGRAAHAAAGVACMQSEVNVRVLTLYHNEAERWRGAAHRNGFTTEISLIPESICSTPKAIESPPRAIGTNEEEPMILHFDSSFPISDNPEEVVPGAELIILAVPASAQEVYLQAMKPYLESNSVVVTMAGHAGFQFVHEAILGDTAKCSHLLVYETLPWLCKVLEYGNRVEITGVKQCLVGASKPGCIPPAQDPVSMLQKAMGPYCRFKVHGHTLGATLMDVNGIGHPAIMYGRWKNWDGQPLEDPPLMFTALDDESADLLAAISNEVLQIRDQIKTLKPDIDLSNVCHIYIWFLRSYSNYICDNQDLRSCLHTNWAFQHITHYTDMTHDGKYVPNFQERYLAEDVPYGLVVIRGVAEIVKVATPNIDEVILWAQEKLGQEYLVNGRLIGKDIGKTRAPQRFGFTTLDDILKPSEPTKESYDTC